MLRYLALCAVAGTLVGRAFGIFARARFHYPSRRAEVSGAHQALLDALDVVEWPGLFVLTLLVSIALWRWLRPASRPPVAKGRASAAAAAFGACFVVALLVIVPATSPGGRLLAGVFAGFTAAVTAALARRLWMEARAAPRSFRGRVAAQLPLATGHLAATAAASLSLGYRGESALVHGIALLTAIGLFLAEVVGLLITAALAGRTGAQRSPALRTEPYQT